jgi:hypothetical protein
LRDRCVELYFQGVAPKILFTGKFGNWTHGLWAKTEAETFADRAISMGVREAVVLIEGQGGRALEDIIIWWVLTERIVRLVELLLLWRFCLKRILRKARQVDIFV